jgi:prepilin-type processing-associated H-X9-DG protein
MKLTDIKEPGRTLLIADSGYALINWWHAADFPPVNLKSTPVEDSSYIPGLSINSNRVLRPEMINDAVYGRHLDKKINIGFADGHIESQPAEFVLIQKIGDDYKNRCPLWCPK